MIHGFGGGGAIFVKMIPYLQNYFDVIGVDLLGMGGSGRPVYNCETPEDALDFHLDSLKAWEDKQIKGEKYYLLGHSFGGYIAV